MKQLRFSVLILALMSILTLALLLSAGSGAVSISLSQMGKAITGDSGDLYSHVFLQIRLPRVVTAAVAGSILTLAGLMMQNLFRNPIVEPGIIGTSAGAALGASAVFVFGASIHRIMPIQTDVILVPIFAFIGGLFAAWLVYRLAGSSGETAASVVLLTGIAVNALAISGTGFMSYVARDPQARSITFWNLGTFSGASWPSACILITLFSVLFFWMRQQAFSMNLFLLGEADAFYSGINTKRYKNMLLLMATAGVSIVTAFAGVIGFVGLIVPHMARMLVGSEHKKLIPIAALLGAIMLTIADWLARIIVAPAEFPIGIITALVGAPAFLWQLRQQGFTKKGGME